MFIDISSFKHESMGGKRHWLIVVDEFSDCSHRFFLRRKNDQIELFPDWIKELKAKYGIDIKYIRLDNSGEKKALKMNVRNKILGSSLNLQLLEPLNKILWLRGKYLH